ncbi:MAG: hypothetical protein DME97_08980 [Verrucomicrobia bacterium]|nr:MAG: hypothetical protein DME97_08980 [Verrucomicrobiota bacterium]
MQLSEKDKMRIRSEELYREEVRRELANNTLPKSFPKRFLRWLGTPLGLWFLSAILLGSITEAYKTFQTKQVQERARADAEQAEERMRRELIRKLDAEIALRLNRVNDRVLAFAKDKLTTLDVEEAGRIVHYPEFRDRSMTSLMFELQGSLEKAEQKAVRVAMGKWFILQHWEAHKGFAQQHGGWDALSFFEPLLYDIYIERWRKDVDAIIEARK